MGDVKMKTAVVINRRYGGYGLSAKAMALYNERASDGHDERYVRDIPRDCPILIDIVRELGDEANGPGGELVIVEVEVLVEIRNYDGKENVYVHGGEV